MLVCKHPCCAHPKSSDSESSQTTWVHMRLVRDLLVHSLPTSLSAPPRPQAHLLMQDRFKGRSISAPAAFMEPARAAWIAQACGEMSSYQWQVGVYVQRCGTIPAHEFRTPDGNFAVDLALPGLCIPASRACVRACMRACVTVRLLLEAARITLLVRLHAAKMVCIIACGEIRPPELSSPNV